MSTSRSQEQDLLQRFKDVDDQVGSVFSGRKVFGETSLPLRGFHQPELGFIRLVSWLWSLERETGREAIEFISLQLRQHGAHDAVRYVENVQTLRTHLQHHLKSEEQEEVKKARAARQWLEAAAPGFDEDLSADWNEALEALIGEADKLAVAIMDLVRSLQQDDLVNLVQEAWEAHVRRSVPAYEIDQMIEEIAPIYGLKYIKTKAFRERHLPAWRDHLKIQTATTDVRAVLRGLIEGELARTALTGPPPISGERIMEVFGIPPGKRVGEMVLAARELTSRSKYTETQLLKTLSQQFKCDLLVDLEEAAPSS